VSKKADKLTDSKDEPVDMPSHVGAEDVPLGTPAPRAARFGEGGEGSGGRRERGVAGPRAGFFTRMTQFLRDVRAEMKRVSWPTPGEVKNTTIITIIAVIFFSIYLFIVDQGLAFLITQLTHLVEWLAGSA
jgi:preprotein translocase subunit SecE